MIYMYRLAAKCDQIIKYSYFISYKYLTIVKLLSKHNIILEIIIQLLHLSTLYEVSMLLFRFYWCRLENYIPMPKKTVFDASVPMIYYYSLCYGTYAVILRLLFVNCYGYKLLLMSKYNCIIYLFRPAAHARKFLFVTI